MAAMAEAVARLARRLEDCRLTADEYRELDDERVLVLDHGSGARQERAAWSSGR